MSAHSSTSKVFLNLLLFAGLLSGMISCKKEMNNPVEPPIVAQKLKEFKTGEEYIRFDYKTSGQVNKVTIKNDETTAGIEMTYLINYDLDKIVSLESGSEKIVPVYENNLLKRADIFQANERVGYTNYHFESGLLKRATIYFGQDTYFEPFLDFIFSYNATGNITETVIMTARIGEPGYMERAGHITYQYDQKNNPLYANKNLLTLFWQAVSKNNIKVEDHFDAQLQPEDKFVYEYQYNNNGLPASASVKQGLPGQSGSDSQLHFSYQ